MSVLHSQASISEQTVDYSAFIACAKADKAVARAIVDELEGRGLKCWIAPRDARAGRAYAEEIVRGIERSRCLVLVLSKSANASNFVRKEVERAVAKDKPICTMRVEDVEPSSKLELFVSDTHWIDAWEAGSFKTHAEALAEWLFEETGAVSDTAKPAIKQRKRQAEPEGKIFISYRRGDDPGSAGRLFDRLRRSFAADQLFMDVESIDPGLPFARVLQDRMNKCDVFLAVIGPFWTDAQGQAGERRLNDPNDFVRIEIETALKLRKAIIPVLVKDADMPRAEQLPEGLRQLSKWQAVRLTHERFNADTQGLIRAIKKALKKAAAAKAEEAARQEQERHQVSTKLENLLWRDLINAPTVARLNSFIEKLPGGVHTTEARARRDELLKTETERRAVAERQQQELAAWNVVKDTTDLTALSSFIEKFPGGAHTTEARALRDVLLKTEAEQRVAAEREQKELAAWNAVKDAADPAALSSFLDTFPNGAHATTARALLNTLLDKRRQTKRRVAAARARVLLGIVVIAGGAWLALRNGEENSVSVAPPAEESTSIQSAELPGKAQSFATNDDEQDQIVPPSTAAGSQTATLVDAGGAVVPGVATTTPGTSHPASSAAEVAMKSPVPEEPTAGELKVYANHDILGNELRRAENVSESACSAMCSAERDCAAYTYDKWNRWCFLKSSADELLLSPKAISGVRAGVPEPGYSSLPVEMKPFRGNAFPGGETTLSATSFEACEQRCLAATSCVAFTYFKSSKQCRLMESAGEYSANKAADSGAKFQVVAGKGATVTVEPQDELAVDELHPGIAPPAQKSEDWQLCIGREANDAIAACTRIINHPADESGGSLAMAYKLRGLAHRQKGEVGHQKSEYDVAIADFDQAIKLKPDFADAYSSRGIAYSKKSKYDLAIADFDQAIKLKPDFADAYFNRGSAYSRQNKYSLAVSDFLQAIAHDPKLAAAYTQLGISYKKLGDKDKARDYFSKVGTLPLVPDYSTDEWARKTSEAELKKLADE